MNGPGSGPRRGPGVGVVLAASASAILLVTVGVVILLLIRGPEEGGAGMAGSSSSSSSGAITPPPTTPPPATADAGAPPAVLEECSDSGEAVLPRSGRGTEATSCAFAVEVRDAYFRTARPGDPAMVEAFSPTTGERYEMGCVENHNDGGIICRGGNDAVVILY